MFDRISAGIRAIFERPGPVSATAGSYDRWRFDPGDWNDLWTRASVIHFPDDNPRQRVFPTFAFADPAFERPAAGSGSPGEFQGFRPFEPGDDPREVDWRATARARKAMVRQRSNEGRRPVAIVVDVSASMWVENTNRADALRPVDIAFETAVWLSAAATMRQSPLDVILASDRIELHLARLRGRQAIRQVVDAASAFRPEHSATAWSDAVHGGCRFRPGSYVFWVSDFAWLPDPLEFRRTFSHVQSLGVRIESDAARVEALGGVVRDAETGEVVDASRIVHGRSLAERTDRWSAASGVPVLDMNVRIERPELLLADWLDRAHAVHGWSR